MKKLILLPFVLFCFLSCKKQLDKNNYNGVTISRLRIQQIASDNNGEPWDDSFGQAPDPFVVIKDSEGSIFHQTESHWNVSWENLPLEYYRMWQLEPLPYRKQIVLEVYDEDSNDPEHQLIGRVSFFPFLQKIDDHSSNITLSDDNITLRMDLLFHP